MLKKFMFLVLLFANDAFAEAENDPKDCSLKCGTYDAHQANRIYCKKNCKSEVCSESCNSGKKFIENKEFCNPVCYSYIASDLCEKECVTDEDLETNYAYCKRFCSVTGGCLYKCDYDNFDKNEKFCGYYCSSNSTESCEKTCSTIELISSATAPNCKYGCSRYLPALCIQNCNSTKEFLTNYNFCTKSCDELNSKLCKNLCSTVDLFNENYDFCFNSCDAFPELICNEKCFNVENFTLNADLCYRGCSHFGGVICIRDCDTPENFLKYEFCSGCTLAQISLCSKICWYKSSFDTNMKFCIENCWGFPNEICSEKCNSTEIILKDKEFCIRGCDPNLTKLCVEKCSTVELTNINTEYCKFCKTKPIRTGGTGYIVSGIEIKPKTCISLLCG